jgi:hypothetical protein
MLYPRPNFSDSLGFLLLQSLLEDQEGMGGEDDQETLPGSTDS